MTSSPARLSTPGVILLSDWGFIERRANFRMSLSFKCRTGIPSFLDRGEPFLRANLSDILAGKCHYPGISQPVAKIGFL
jgi:hypothetical protein